MTLNTIKGIKKFANFGKSELEVKPPAVLEPPAFTPPAALTQVETVGLNLKYTINLNLPATSDIAVFNAIFKSLKENLLKGSDANG
jgi:hypothetical protein